MNVSYMIDHIHYVCMSHAKYHENNLLSYYNKCCRLDAWWFGWESSWKKPAITQIISHSLHTAQQSRYSCAFISRPTSLIVSDRFFVFCFMKVMLWPNKLSHKHFKVVCNMYPRSLKKYNEIDLSHPQAEKISDVTPAT